MSDKKSTRLGDILKIRSSNRVLESDYVDEGVPFLRGSELTKLDKGIDIKSKLFITKELFKELKAKSGIPKIGDLLITANGTVGNPYLVNINYDFYFKDAIIWIKQNKKVSNKYIYYVYKSTIIHEQIMNDSFGSTIINYNLNQAKKNIIPFHSISQQTAIANYLDHHTTKIDKEISLLEQKVEKLDEYKQALIYETVTKGLDKNVPMKDSGIEWIGMIPEHWEVKRVKDVFSTLNKSIISSSDADEDGNYDFYISGAKLKKSNIFNLTKEALLLPTGGSYMVHYPKKVPCAYSTDVLPIIVNKTINLKFAFYLLSHNKSYFNENYFWGSGLKHLQRNAFFNSEVITTNLIEQQQIAEYLDEQCSKIDKKKELINKKVELLKEYKQSLIYEAVTGKIEIKHYRKINDLFKLKELKNKSFTEEEFKNLGFDLEILKNFIEKESPSYERNFVLYKLNNKAYNVIEDIDKLFEKSKKLNNQKLSFDKYVQLLKEENTELSVTWFYNSLCLHDLILTQNDILKINLEKLEKLIKE